jgi:hypothetical protein
MAIRQKNKHSQFNNAYLVQTIKFTFPIHLKNKIVNYIQLLSTYILSFLLQKHAILVINLKYDNNVMNDN